jgi:branched-chain amino acid transport system substrate-binding protein
MIPPAGTARSDVTGRHAATPRQSALPRRPRRWFVATVAGALVGASSLALTSACTLQVPPPATPTAVPGPTVSPDDLAVGVILSQSGRYSREGALMKAGYQTWLDAVDRAGGVRLGGERRRVRLVYADDESEPLTAAQRVDRLVTLDGTRLLLGPFSSPITGAAATAADKLGALLVAPDATAPDLFRRGLKLLVSLKPTDNRLLHGIADLAATVTPRAEPIGMLVSDEAPVITEVEGLRERALALGLNPVIIEAIAPGQTDLAGTLERLSQQSPSLLVVAATPTHIARLVARVEDALPPIPMRAFLHLPEQADTASRATSPYDGALMPQLWSSRRAFAGPVLGSAGQFAEQFQRLHGYVPDDRCAVAAAAGLALQLGIERAASIEPKAVRQALGGLDVLSFWGRLAWDVDGRSQAPAAPIVQWRPGGGPIVYPPELANGRVQYPLRDWPRP